MAQDEVKLLIKYLRAATWLMVQGFILVAKATHPMYDYSTTRMDQDISKLLEDHNTLSKAVKEW